MARKTSPPAPGPASLDAQTALTVLTKQLQSGEQLGARGGPDESAYSSWVSESQHWVEQSFGENSPKANEFSMAGAGGFVFTSETDFAQVRREALASQVNKLRAFTNVLKQTCELQASQSSPAPRERRTSAASSNKVFVVHGHEDGAKQTVARYLEKLELEPVVLHEQPSAGRTIIEKFEAFADVAFAVVLLTPDDRGGTASTPYERQALRARQNVVLELGYFLGKLGRERVCALYKDGTEIPSDFQGVLFVPMDAAGAWRLLLGRELKHVLPGVDLNNAT